jgi:hypothetical protein
VGDVAVLIGAPAAIRTLMAALQRADVVLIPS